MLYLYKTYRFRMLYNFKGCLLLNEYFWLILYVCIVWFQARIAFLQGEHKGLENLKNDLVRRIKMLEYALKQERAKYHKLKYGVEPQPLGDARPPSPPDPEGQEPPPSVTWRQGRQLIRQYFEVTIPAISYCTLFHHQSFTLVTNHHIESLIETLLEKALVTRSE